MSDGVRNFGSDDILDAENANHYKAPIFNGMENAIRVHILVIRTTLSGLEIFVGKTDCS
jgi:hypothetical protein